MTPRVERTLRRAGPFLGVGVLLLLLAIPAFFDLRGLLVALGLIAIGLGVVSGLFNWFDRPAAPLRPNDPAGGPKG